MPRCCTPPLQEDVWNTPSQLADDAVLAHNSTATMRASSPPPCYAVLFTSLLPEFVCVYLEPRDVVHMSLASKAMHRIIQQPQVWRTMLQSHFRYSAADIHSLDRMSAGLSEGGGDYAAASGVGSPYVRAPHASSLVLRPGCTIDPLMLAPGMPRLARVLSGPPQLQKTTRSSPDRATFTPFTCCGALTCSQGVTPTPSRAQPWSVQDAAHRHADVYAAAAPPFPFNDGVESSDMFHLHATVHELMRGAGARQQEMPHEDDWSVRWMGDQSVDNEPPVAPHHTLQQQSEYLFHVEQGTRGTTNGMLLLEPLVSSSAAQSDYDSDEDGYVYGSGALVLGNECHNRFSEIWESREMQQPPTVDTTVLHLPMEPLEFSDPFVEEGGVRSGSIKSCWVGSVNDTPIPRLLASPPSTTTWWGDAPPNGGWCHPQHHSEGRNSSVVLASVVCAETLVSSLRCGGEAYNFQKLYAYLYQNRIRHFLASIAVRQQSAVTAAQQNQHATALQSLTQNIEVILEGGCGNGSNRIAATLVRNLVLRGRLLRMLGRDREALADFSMAYTMDASCKEAYTESTIIITSADRCATHASSILSSTFDVDVAYDDIVTAGKSVMERAAFLFEVMFWKGPSCTLYLHQYILCDAAGFRPVRLLLEAEVLASAPHERLTVRAWIQHDNGDIEKARTTAELAVSLIPHDMTRVISAAEQRFIDLAKCLVDTPNIEALMTAHAPATTAQTIERLTSLRNAVQSLSDADLSAALVAVSAEALEPFVAALRRANGSSTETSAMTPPQQPSMVSAAFAYFTLAYLNGESDVAVDAYRRHLYAGPLPSRTGSALNNVGFIMFKRLGAALALPLFEAARDVYPTHFRNLKNLAKCYAMLGRRDDAIRAITAVADCTHFRGPRADALYDRFCMAHFALNDLKRASELNPRCGNTYRLRAALIMDRGDAAGAVAELDKIISLTMSAEDVALRALFRRDAGDRAGAMRDMALAVTLMPSFKEYRSTLRELVFEDVQQNWSPFEVEAGDIVDGESVASPQSPPDAHSPSLSTPTGVTESHHERLRNSVIDEETDKAIISAVRWF